MTVLTLDHITVAAQTLAAGVAYVEQALGVRVSAGGVHLSMGTHNHLLRLGDDVFLEVLAIDPAAPAPTHPRWFALDASDAPQRLARPQVWTWVVRTQDLDTALLALPSSAGRARHVSRGALAWRIAVNDDGAMAFEGAFPSVIEWPPGDHPALRMPPSQCALEHFDIVHPQAEAISKCLAPHLRDGRIALRVGSTRRLSVCIATPHGKRVL